MKHGFFYKTIYSKNAPTGYRFEKTKGYIHTLTDKHGRAITLCFDKTRPRYWTVTEKTSGLRICDGFNTRKEALAFVKSQYLDAIYDKLIDCKYISLLSNFLENGGANIYEN